MGQGKHYESFVLWTKDTCKHEFTLAGCTLKKCTKPKYLGVTLTEEGVYGIRKMVERIKKAKNVLGVLKKARGVKPMVYIQRGQSDYISP